MKVKDIAIIITIFYIIGLIGSLEIDRITITQLLSLSGKAIIMCCALLYIIERLRKWYRKHTDSNK